MNSKADKFFELAPADQWMLLRSFALVALVRLGLSWRTLAQVRQRLAAWIAARPAYPVDEAQREKLIWSVRVVSRFVPMATCLTQALATQALLGRAGIQTQLRLGVLRDESGVFRAHAWVECDGRVLIGEQGELQNYAAFAPIPSHQF